MSGIRINHILLLAPKNKFPTFSHQSTIMDYYRLFEESPAPMYLYEAGSYAFLAVNRAAQLQYGYTPEEFMAMTVLDIRPAGDVGLFIDSNVSLLPTYQDYGRWTHQRRDGSTFTVHVFANTVYYEGKEARAVLAIDIEERVRAEQALAEKNAEIEGILESITDGFYMLDRDWTFTYFNKAAERILRKTRTECIGNHIWKCFPEAEAMEYEGLFKRAMAGESVQFENYYPPLDLWTSISVYPTPDGIAVYLIDITEQKRYLQHIEKQNEKLKDIAWMQSHEVRGPLSNIMGLADLLPCEMDDDGSYAHIMQLLKEEALRLDGIVRKISADARDTIDRTIR